MTTDGHDVTGLLVLWASGDRNALDLLLPLVYDELRRLAHRELGREHRQATLVTTALVHEAYLRLHRLEAAVFGRVRSTSRFLSPYSVRFRIPRLV